MSLYTHLIIATTGCGPEEAPLVEGFLRVTYGTLDGLDRATFRREGKKCLTSVRANPKLAEDLARSYGLLRTRETSK
jgi:hypothetical protein